MKKESIKRVLLCSACSIALAFSMVGTAFAYNYQKESSYRYWYVNPTYRSYNKGGIQSDGILPGQLLLMDECIQL